MLDYHETEEERNKRVDQFLRWAIAIISAWSMFMLVSGYFIGFAAGKVC